MVRFSSVLVQVNGKTFKRNAKNLPPFYKNQCHFFKILKYDL